MLFVDSVKDSFLLFALFFCLRGVTFQCSYDFLKFFGIRSALNNVLLCLEEVTCPLFGLLLDFVHLFLYDLLLQLDAVYLAEEVLVANVLRLSGELVEVAAVAGEGLVGAGFLQVHTQRCCPFEPLSLVTVIGTL